LTQQISDHALIGDCHSSALVALDGTVTWATFPRFDSPSTFCKILDEDRGGSFAVAPDGVTSTERAYVDGTNVLVTTFRCEGGTLELTDCMPVVSGGRHSRDIRTFHSILRRLHCTDGAVDVRITVEPRFEYGRFVPHFRLTSEETAEAVGGADSVRIAATRLLDESSERISARWHLRAGETEWIEAAWAPSSTLDRADGAKGEFERKLDDTVAFWKTWSERCAFDEVLRSALVLKALTYAPTGAVVAAPTTSLPEAIGGERNWDYRFTWIRDATLTLISLFALGFREEADAFKFYMERTSAGRPSDVQIMYGIGGERFLPELILDHLAGHQGSVPVRIGNGAAKQRQLDVYGQLIESAFLFSKAGGRITPDNWNFLAGLADIVASSWRDPDQGIWEIRDEPRHFVHSKVNCWAALDRAVRIATARTIPAPIERWTAERDALRTYLMDDAEGRGWFSQAVGSDAPDASVLLVPALGFLPASHPLVSKTIDVVRSELGDGALLLRYEAPDGLEGGEGSFLLCSFWLADALAFAGRIDEAEAVLAELESYRNDVGLWAEQTDPATKQARGNFPQAFTHMAHITSRLYLDAARSGAIDHGQAHDFAEVAVQRLGSRG
jgi:GH15 family glucan-1,4-alpha-glucosidase